MTNKMILVPGRSSKQGISLNKGKLKQEYIDVTSTLEVNEDDMKRLGLVNGDQVKLSNDIGQAIVSCIGKNHPTYRKACCSFLTVLHQAN